MNEKINTISEEQVLHNELSFEINQELIHLMKLIVEIQRVNKQLKENNMSMQEEMARTWGKADLYKEVIDEAIEYIKEKQKIQYKFALSHIECDDLLQILDILKEK